MLDFVFLPLKLEWRDSSPCSSASLSPGSGERTPFLRQYDVITYRRRHVSEPTELGNFFKYGYM